METDLKDRVSLTEYQREFLSRIIAIQSIGGVPEEGAPYGRKSRLVLQTFLDEAKAKGFRTGVIGDRAGWAEIGQGDKLLGIICHLDVVPVGKGWDSDPFTLCFREDENGVLSMYARGIVDDKGPACAAYFAMLELAAENRIPDGCRVRLILGTDEERTCSCIQYYAKLAEIPVFSITPDSVFPVIYSEKGIMQIELSGDNVCDFTADGGSAVNIVPAAATCEAAGKTITVTGKAAHASKPELGVNAIELLAKAMEENAINLNDYPVMKFVRDFNAMDFIGYEGAGDYGDFTYNIGMLKAGENGCELRIDFRIPYGMDHDEVIEKLTRKAD
ncbi:MAG: M20/M25/M40 family metallo-hydrolase, partial [Lachnospiraceae bacterium]|nr:M20/M25/M40 family metallo-hydrolase [Lachnospiraceae bacterium]